MYQRTALTTGLEAGPAWACGIPAPAQGHGTAAAPVTWGYYTGSGVLKPGATGNAVKELQCLLERCGYCTGPTDGSYGSPLTEAVVRYQRDHGLAADGVVGPRMWAMLRAGVC